MATLFAVGIASRTLRPDGRRTPGRRLTMFMRPVDPVLQGRSLDEQVFLLSTRRTHLLGDVP